MCGPFAGMCANLVDRVLGIDEELSEGLLPRTMTMGQLALEGSHRMDAQLPKWQKYMLPFLG